jgi:hypothetical protein
MAWWTNPNIQIKQKNRFIMSIGEFLIPTVVSVDKPSISIESKEYTMINHVYRYPGIAKWQPITVTFVDGSGNSSVADTSFTSGAQTKAIGGIDSLDTAQQLFMILAKSGYKSGGSVSGVTSKTNMKNLSLLNSVRMEQIEPDGSTVSEGWRLHNPIFTDIKWGSLSYADDGAVEYSLTIAYDWAEYYTGQSVSGGSLFTHSKLRESNADLENELQDLEASIENIGTRGREAAFRDAFRTTQEDKVRTGFGSNVIFDAPTPFPDDDFG